MLLRSPDGVELGLSVEGYQFSAGDNVWDLNWLVVSLRLSTGRGVWETKDPCLLTWEAQRLSSWFTAVLESPHAASLQELRFVEPELQLQLMELSPSEALIRVFLNHAFRPLWAAGDQEFSVDLRLGHSEMRNAGGALSSELEAFPERAVPS